jgi:hypothetical protein
MPLPLLAIAAGALAAKAASKIAKKKAQSNANKEQKRATTAQLTIGQKQREDARRARLDAGSSLLGGVPKTTAGGGVNTNVGLDPELVKRLGVERTYDFGSALPDANKGATWALLSGLFGDVGDFGADYAMGGMGGGSTAPWQDVSRSAGSNPWAQGTAQLPGWDRGAPNGGSTPLHFMGGDDSPGTLDWEELFRQQGEGAE